MRPRNRRRSACSYLLSEHKLFRPFRAWLLHEHLFVSWCTSMVSCGCRKLAEDDSCCVESQGMAGLQDKLFVLNYKKGLETLRQRHIEAIVRERFTIVGEDSVPHLTVIDPESADAERTSRSLSCMLVFLLADVPAIYTPACAMNKAHSLYGNIMMMRLRCPRDSLYMRRYACLQDAVGKEAAGAEADCGLCHGACAGGARGPVQDAPGRLPGPAGPPLLPVTFHVCVP